MTQLAGASSMPQNNACARCQLGRVKRAVNGAVTASTSTGGVNIQQSHAHPSASQRSHQPTPVLKMDKAKTISFRFRLLGEAAACGAFSRPQCNGYANLPADIAGDRDFAWG